LIQTAEVRVPCTTLVLAMSRPRKKWLNPVFTVVKHVCCTATALAKIALGIKDVTITSSMACQDELPGDQLHVEFIAVFAAAGRGQTLTIQYGL
jgi:hypothetical protein